MKPQPSKPPLPMAARLRLQRLLVRLGMLAILAISLVLLWWSLFVRLAPVNRLYQVKTRELSNLSGQADQLRLEWTAPKLAQLETRFQDAQRLVFSDPQEVADWGKEIQTRTPPGLEGTMRWDAPQLYRPGELKLMSSRGTLNLHPVAAPGVTNSPYLRLLDFTRTLEKETRRVDLLSLSVGGESNAVRQVELVLQVWSWERSSK